MRVADGAIHDSRGRGGNPWVPKPKSVEFSRTASQTPPSPSAPDFELSNSDSPSLPVFCFPPHGPAGQGLNSSVVAPAQQSCVTAVGVTLEDFLHWDSGQLAVFTSSPFSPSYLLGSLSQPQDLR